MNLLIIQREKIIIKRNKLERFITNSEFSHLSPRDQQLSRAQLEAIEEYLDILESRIKK